MKTDLQFLKRDFEMNLTKTSKFIALILRHKPETIGISLDEHGWAEEIVRMDEKQRYSFNEDKSLIRANQGHSIPVDVELKECTPPDILYHGTGEKYVASIDAQGLIPKGRLYVHMSADTDTARNVGCRHGKPVIYEIDCRSMAADGYKFYLSENHVWLTKSVPACYLRKLY